MFVLFDQIWRAGGRSETVNALELDKLNQINNNLFVLQD